MAFITLSLENYNDYSANLTIETLQGEKIYETQFNSPEELDSFIRDFGRSCEPCGIAQSSIIPVRTNFKDFYKDLFLPTVVNRAWAIDGIVKKSFALLFSLAFDVLFFPIRVVTFIPRAIYNAFQKNHPLYDFLTKQQGIAEKVLGNGLLILRCREETSLAGDASIEDAFDKIEDPEFKAGEKGFPLQFGTEKTLDLHKSDHDKRLDHYSFKYFCDPNWNRKNQAVIPVHYALDGTETSKIVRTETIERDLRWKVIPHSSWGLKANITKAIFRKNLKNEWEKHADKTYPPIDFRSYTE